MDCMHPETAPSTAVTLRTTLAAFDHLHSVATILPATSTSQTLSLTLMDMAQPYATLLVSAT